ncbi:MAG: thioredoxin family protein [Xanthobacteraceae bacterium]
MRFDRRTVLSGAILTALGIVNARAANRRRFEAATFRAAQESGQIFVLEVTAKWCGPCQRQKQVVEKLLENSAFDTLTIFNADYDADRSELTKINAHQLTTLIIYRGKTEELRSSGETRPEMVEAILRRAL